MVYKRYIKKDGKIYGPYEQHNKKIGGKVVTEYIGKSGSVKENFSSGKRKVSKKRLIVRKVKKLSRKVISKNRAVRRKIKTRAFKKKAKKVGKVMALLFVIGVFVFLFLSFLNFSITGKVGLNIKSKYIEGETLEGNLKFSLKQGELVPVDSKLIVNLGEEYREYFLSDFVDLSLEEGFFYAENTTLFGNGFGYGLIGVKETYPDVSFQLKVIDSGETETSDTSTEVPEETPTEIPVENEIEIFEENNETIPESDEMSIEEEVIEIEEESVEEVVEETSTGGKVMEIQTEKEVAKEVKKEEKQEVKEVAKEVKKEEKISPMTGEVIGDFSISGTASKGNDFEYELEENQDAEIFAGSVKFEGNVLGDDVVSLKVKKNQAVVSTDYSYEEKGFGEDYVGDGIMKINIELNQFDLIAKSDSELVVKLVYENKTLTEFSKFLSVEEVVEDEDVVIGINLTEINEIIVNEIPEKITIDYGDIRIETVQYGAVLNMPVKWKKRIILNQSGNLTVKLPKQAENIVVYKLSDTNVLEDDETEANILDNETNANILENNKTEANASEVQVEINKTSTLITARVISGRVSAEIEIYDGFSIIGFFKNLFRFTGRVVEVEEKEQEKDVIIEDDAKEYEIEYFTPGPVAVEKRIFRGKDIAIFSEISYENVLVYTELPKEISKDKIKLSDSLGAVDFDAYDSNWNKIESFLDYSPWVDNKSKEGSVIYNQSSNFSNISSEICIECLVNETVANQSKAKYITWIIPNLDYQTYELIIEILSAEHFYANGTFISDIYEEVKKKDDNWSEVISGPSSKDDSGGSEYVRVIFEENLTNEKDLTVYARGENASIEVYLGNETIAVIENISEEGWYKTYLTNMTGEYDTFDLRVNGAVEFDYIVDPVQLLPTASKFEIKNSTGSNIAFFDFNGNLFLKGTKFESQILSSPTLNSFVIKNSSGSMLAYINESGYLFLSGNITENSVNGLTTTNLEIRNSFGSLIGFFDNVGNLKLNGSLYENYANP